ncbi:Aminoacyl tRNA editing domain [Trypanosoma vivax]|uniref:YbaK/aminoacyl-tRNA synthetase-associated domain-containing protein n=1 Tax=Trypanosoma vivax (strain Y486) TaxID=1055687 RepID=G0U5C1_TRYVY|nr:hypothetical protein TRVL_01868 [Trypanosoma vivax]KAH8618443.1 Aminoacyl tRNA editing domain [Trypanosoma vivax]CCC51069.1 conserved hypothetical protein [Trypanosoma vivax Y486]
MNERLDVLARRFAAVEKGIEEVRRGLALLVKPVSKKSRHVDPSDLKELQPCAQDTPEVAALRRWCIARSLTTAVFRWVPSDYYQRSLQWRRDILGAPSTQHICKSIFMENTHCVHADCSHSENSRYYLVVFPYTERFDAERLMQFVRGMNEGLGKKKFNFRAANPDVALKLTGFTHGAVVPFGTATEIPVILSEQIARLTPPVFWMGGGHVDCKVRVDVAQYIEVIKPFIANVTVPLSEEELTQLLD